MKTYEVDSYDLGKPLGNRIVFKNVEDMESAYKDLDEGKDIVIAKDGLLTKLPFRMINTKVYDGSVVFSAKQKEGEKC